MSGVRALGLSALLMMSVTALVAADVPSPKDLRSWVGTYDCLSQANPHTVVITPILGGSVLRISGNGKGASEQLMGYDPKRNVLVMEFYAQGFYATYIGSIHGAGIDFTATYPPGLRSSVTVRRLSTSKYHTDFTSTIDGKTAGGFEDCSRR